MTLEKRPLLDNLVLKDLEDFEARVEKLPESTHKTLMTYELKSVMLDLKNIEAKEVK